MQNRFDLLVSDVMPIYISYLDFLITMLNSINFSTVSRLPTIILMLLREVLRLELALVFLQEERVMQKSSVSISLSF